MNTAAFNTVNKAITDDIKKMLRLKGHYDLGNLERSINELFFEENGALHLRATALDYMEDLEIGVSADKIDERKIDVTKLAGWVGRKISATGSEAIARAIIQKWKKVGKPTDPSSLLTVEETFHENQSRYNVMLDTAVIGDLDNDFHTIQSGTI